MYNKKVNKKFCSIIILLFFMTLTFSGIFLLSACSFNPPKSSDSGEIVPPTDDSENGESPENPDDEEIEANVSWDFEVRTVFRDGGAGDAYYSKFYPYFYIYWRYGDNTPCKFGSGLWKKDITTVAALEQTVTGGGNADTYCGNLASFKLKWSGAEENKMAYISATNISKSYYKCFGVSKSLGNDVCREERTTNYINGSGVYTYAPSASSSITGTFNVVYRMEYTNTYKMNGGTYSGSTSDQTQTTYAGIGFDLFGNPTRTGYTFVGWREGNGSLWNGSNPWGNGNAATKDEWANSNKTFTAEWTLNSYKVDINIMSPGGVQDYVSGTMTTTYSSDGVTYSNISDQARDIIPYNTTVTIKNISPAVGMSVRSVSCNKGSISSSGGGNYTYRATMTGVPSGSWDDAITIQMQWASYTVSFNSNGGSSISSKSVTYKSTYGTLSTPTKTGYTFAGWYKESNFVNQVTSSTVVGIGNHTLYAKWNANIYTVSFNSVGGTSIANKAVLFDSAYGELLTPTRTNYFFRGWMLNGAFVNSSTIVKTASNHTLIAIWRPELGTININIKTSNDGKNYTNSVVGGVANIAYTSFDDVAGNQIAKSASIKISPSSIENVLRFSSLSVTATPNVGFVFVGVSNLNFPPMNVNKPANPFSFPITPEIATVNIFFNKLSLNILKFDKTGSKDLITNFSVTNPVVNSLEAKTAEQNDDEISARSGGFVYDSGDGYYYGTDGSSMSIRINSSPMNMLFHFQIKFINSSVSDTAYFYRGHGEYNLYNTFTPERIVPLGIVYFPLATNDIATISFRGTGSLGVKILYSDFTNIGGDSTPPIQTRNYGFAENGIYYESQNTGIPNSYSLSVVRFTALNQTQLTFTIVNSSETTYDFGIMGNLDSSLTANMDIDTSYYRKFQNAVNGTQTVTYSVSPGSHFIYIKYRKNVSINSGSDSFKFTWSIPKGDIGYFYFEDGEYPQTYVGDSMNNTLNNAASTQLITKQYDLTYNNGTSNDNIPVYTYTDGKKYARVESNGQVKWFKVEPIRWRVSDYGVFSTAYPSGWTSYGAYNTNFTAVSDRVIGIGAFTSQNTLEGWSSKDSDLYKNTLANSSNVGLNYCATNVQIDIYKFGGTAQQVKVQSEKMSYTGMRVATLEEVKINLTDYSAKASDMVKFILNASTDKVDYWTRKLGNNLNNGKIINKAGTESSRWLDQVNGVRFAITFVDGHRI